MKWCTCDYCGGGHQLVHFNGGGYCSHSCASAAEMARRKAGNEGRDRRDAAQARSYQAQARRNERVLDQAGKIAITFTIIGMIVVAVVGGLGL